MLLSQTLQLKIVLQSKLLYICSLLFQILQDRLQLIQTAKCCFQSALLSRSELLNWINDALYVSDALHQAVVKLLLHLGIHILQHQPTWLLCCQTGTHCNSTALQQQQHTATVQHTNALASSVSEEAIYKSADDPVIAARRSIWLVGVPCH